MYNINIKLKYHIIYNELRRLHKEYKGYREPAELDELANELYCSELLLVFHSEEILDEKMVKEFEKLLDRMNMNQGFKMLSNEIINRITRIYFDTKILPNDKKDINFRMFTILFGKQIFHIFHKCIEQQYETGDIESSLFDKLYKAVLSHISICDD